MKQKVLLTTKSKWDRNPLEVLFWQENKICKSIYSCYVTIKWLI